MWKQQHGKVVQLSINFIRKVKLCIFLNQKNKLCPKWCSYNLEWHLSFHKISRELSFLINFFNEKFVLSPTIWGLDCEANPGEAVLCLFDLSSIQLEQPTHHTPDTASLSFVQQYRHWPNDRSRYRPWKRVLVSQN